MLLTMSSIRINNNWYYKKSANYSRMIPLNNFFCEMNIKKVIHWESRGEWRNLPNYFTCISKYITWISKQYLHFYSFWWFLICNYEFFYNTCYINHSSENWHFWSLQSPLLPQFSTYRHRTGFIVKRKQVPIANYLGIPVNC